jgi:hypothetical protein
MVLKAALKAAFERGRLFEQSLFPNRGVAALQLDCLVV